MKKIDILAAVCYTHFRKTEERNISVDMRKRIFEIIETSREGDKASTIYDSLMMALIIASVIPLAFKETNVVFEIVNVVTAVCFVVDYVLRLSTADFKLKRGAASFAIYPFTPMAIIDLLAILPSFAAILPGLRLIRLLRLFAPSACFGLLRCSATQKVSKS